MARGVEMRGRRKKRVAAKNNKIVKTMYKKSFIPRPTTLRGEAHLRLFWREKKSQNKNFDDHITTI